MEKDERWRQIRGVESCELEIVERGVGWKKVDDMKIVVNKVEEKVLGI